MEVRALMSVFKTELEKDILAGIIVSKFHKSPFITIQVVLII